MTLREAVWELLRTDFGQTNIHLVAALQIEYPDIYLEIQKAFIAKFGNGCGALMSPITAVNNVLEELLKENKVARELKQHNFFWRKINS